VTVGLIQQALILWDPRNYFLMLVQVGPSGQQDLTLLSCPKCSPSSIAAEPLGLQDLILLGRQVYSPGSFAVEPPGREKQTLLMVCHCWVWANPVEQVLGLVCESAATGTIVGLRAAAFQLEAVMVGSEEGTEPGLAGRRLPDGSTTVVIGSIAATGSRARAGSLPWKGPNITVLP